MKFAASAAPSRAAPGVFQLRQSEAEATDRLLVLRAEEAAVQLPAQDDLPLHALSATGECNPRGISGTNTGVRAMELVHCGGPSGWRSNPV